MWENPKETPAASDGELVLFSPCCACYTPVEVGNKHGVLLFQHVQKMIPLIFPPGLKPLGPQPQLALEDVGKFVFDLSECNS